MTISYQTDRIILSGYLTIQQGREEVEQLTSANRRIVIATNAGLHRQLHHIIKELC